ncbi:hypothetical protein EUTSA_v10009589mg, partial [Eutrema salsugineum]
ERETYLLSSERRKFATTLMLYVCIHKSVRLISTSPYLTVGTRVKDVLSGGCNIGDILLLDPAKEELATIPDKTIPKELMEEEMIGASHGWAFFSSKSNPTVIPLPRLTALSPDQPDEVCNVAMSSSSPHHQDNDEEDCVVAIKFFGRQLSMCRPGLDLEWTNISTPVFCCDSSNLIPELHELSFRDHPVLDRSQWELLNSCFRTEYLVESPSDGERFLVKWYTLAFSIIPRFMVFREEETTEGSIMCYTEDIGDMCIFLASNEAFCIPASSSPSLDPNTIYFMGRGLGFFHLTTGEAHHYKTLDGVLSTHYWLPPFSI